MFKDQLEIEKRFSKRNLIDVLSKDITVSQVSDVVYSIEEYTSKHYSYESKNARVSKIKDSYELAMLLIANVLRCNGEITGIQGIAASLAKHIDDNHVNAVKTAMEVIAVCDCTVYELMSHDYPDNKTGTLALEPRIKPSEEVLQVIEEYQYMPPNLIKPVWYGNDAGGLISFNDHCILGKNNKHSKYQDLHALNILQEVKFVLDKRMLTYQEEANKPLDTVEKRKQFNIMRKASKNIYDLYADKEFYFIWKYDKRGRMYSQGYHINLQSTDYKKALLSFAKREVITK